MNLAKPKLAFLTTAMLLVIGMKFGGSVDACTPLQNSPTDAGDTTQAKIARAMSAGPTEIASSARIVDTDAQGNTVVLREGNNGFTCMPGNPRVIGDPPMCIDALGMQWFKDLVEGKPQPTNAAPGLCYMLCGATQHSNTTPHDRTSPAIPIGPHWMILWPFDANHCGLPTTVRDAGAWIMFAGTPYAYLHVCGTPWAGAEYTPGDEALWTMRYRKKTAS